MFLGDCVTSGAVYRYDKSGSAWNATRLDNAAAGALPLTGLVTDLEVDPTDATHSSIYLSFAGTGDYRHVWHFDGTKWTARSGPSAGAATSLLDVEHNALAVDPSNPSTVFVGMRRYPGVWKSVDGGANWTVLENGLPDAAVLDLLIHQPSRLLRAGLQGRGVFQYKLDAPAQADTELYIRDTDLDLGLVATVDGLPDPADPPTTKTAHWESPNIKVDVPTPAGYQTPTTQIDFLQFNDVIVDGSQGVVTIATGTVTNRVYVEVHNRGITPASSVRIMLLLADASPGLPSLPAGYTANVTAGTPIATSAWQTVGFQTITNLEVGFPQVAEFNLPSTMLPPPASLPGQSPLLPAGDSALGDSGPIHQHADGYRLVGRPCRSQGGAKESAHRSICRNASASFGRDRAVGSVCAARLGERQHSQPGGRSGRLSGTSRAYTTGKNLRPPQC